MKIEFKLPKEVRQVIQKVKGFGFEIYIVGGAVRDILMGRPIFDWDFATNATPEKILSLFPEGFYNNKFGTVGVKTDLGIFEITTYRKEGEYRDFRHPEKISWGKTIEEDLSRRDFTINAQALSTTGELIDPFDGKKDLKEKSVKAVGNPGKRFTEDALRLARAVRIATELEFLIEPQTFAAIVKNASLIRNISGERVRDELFKILASNHAADGFLLLRNAKLLKHVLPELEACFGVEQASPGRHHIFDVGTHSVKSLQFCPSGNPLVRFATLLHDIGKPATREVRNDGTVTFYNHEVIGARMATNISERLHLSRKEREKLFILVRWHLFTVDEATTPAAARRFIRRVGVENISDMLDLRIGDRLGGGLREATSWRLRRFMKMIEAELHPPFAVADLAISGHDVMRELGIEPGPKVGQILAQLFEEVLEDRKRNTRDYLLARLKQLAKELPKL